MTKTLNRLLIGAIIAGLIGCDIAAAETKTPMERVTGTPRGQLKRHTLTSRASPSRDANYFKRTTVAGVTAAAAVEEWQRLSPTKFGSTAAMMTPCSA